MFCSYFSFSYVLFLLFLRGPLLKEFFVNVDHVVRDGARIRVVESTYFGAQTRLLHERTLFAGSLLPDAQKRAQRASIEAQCDKLRKLLHDYEALYQANAVELRRIKRDIDALEHELQVLDTVFNPVDPATGIEVELRFISTDLSPPTNMTHSMHVG